MSSRESPTAMHILAAQYPRALHVRAHARAFDAPAGIRWYASHDRNPAHLLGRRAMTPLSTSRSHSSPAQPRSRATSVEIESPRNRCETSRPRDQGVWYSSRPANRRAAAPAPRTPRSGRRSMPALGRGDDAVGQPLELAVDTSPQPSSKMYAELSRSAARPRRPALAAARVEHTSTPAREQAWSARAAERRPAVRRRRQQRGTRARAGCRRDRRTGSASRATVAPDPTPPYWSQCTRHGTDPGRAARRRAAW